jgi:hypothetical protein
MFIKAEVVKVERVGFQQGMVTLRINSDWEMEIPLMLFPVRGPVEVGMKFKMSFEAME